MIKVKKFAKMNVLQGLLCSFSLLPSVFCVFEAAQKLKSFPDEFEFGVATAAYQIEGAWNIDGKGWSIWDYAVHTQPEKIVDHTNGDIAANSYNLFERDIEMMKELGVKNYRFSISWPRILPYGHANYVNPHGVAYYNALIDELLANGIEPLVTIYHWDLPENLSEQGGWLSDKVVDWFGDYARVLFHNFGDRVKRWVTINEPSSICYFGYGKGWHAPLIESPGVGYYECGRHILLSNAKAYHIYDKEFRSHQKGQVGFVVHMVWPIAASKSDADQQAVQDFAAFQIRHFLDPIFTKKGNYPQIVIDRVAAASAEQNLTASRLIPFTQEQIDDMKGAADFLGLNHYGSLVVYRNSSVAGQFPVPSIDQDQFVGTYLHPEWPINGFFSEYPEGFRQLLKYLKDNYNNPTIYITENGRASDPGRDDEPRANYIRRYLSALFEALSDGVKVKGYYVWSLMDNFEWSFGYTMRFGLYDVDFNAENRTRTPKKSAFVYKDIIRNRAINFSYNPDPYVQNDGSSRSSSFIPIALFFVVISIVSF